MSSSSASSEDLLHRDRSLSSDEEEHKYGLRHHFTPQRPVRKDDYERHFLSTKQEVEDTVHVYTQRAAYEMERDQIKKATEAAQWVNQKMKEHKRLDFGVFKTVVYLPHHDNLVAYKEKLSEILPNTLFDIKPLCTKFPTYTREEWCLAARHSPPPDRLQLVAGCVACTPVRCGQCLLMTLGCCLSCNTCVTAKDVDQVIDNPNTFFQNGYPFLITVLKDPPVQQTMPAQAQEEYQFDSASAMYGLS